MASGPAPICLECIHFWNKSHDTFKCDAFPLGIPYRFKFGGDKSLLLLIYLIIVAISYCYLHLFLLYEIYLLICFLIPLGN